MKEIIGDDYPTYEESVNMTLAEQKKDSTYTYMTEIEHQITKDNLERLIKENFEKYYLTLIFFLIRSKYNIIFL